MHLIGILSVLSPVSQTGIFYHQNDRVLDIPDILHHRYPEVISLPTARCEPEIDDEFPRKREEDQPRDSVGEEAGGSSAGEDGDIQRRSTGEEEAGEGRDERDLPGEGCYARLVREGNAREGVR